MEGAIELSLCRRQLRLISAHSQWHLVSADGDSARKLPEPLMKSDDTFFPLKHNLTFELKRTGKYTNL